MSLISSDIGLSGNKKIFHNLSFEELHQHELKAGLKETKMGSIAVDTGVYTGRSPQDKYFVKQDPSQKNINWSNINQATSKEIFDELFIKVKEYLSTKDVYVSDLSAGASKKSKIKVRFITELAFQAHFVKNMFIRPKDEKDIENFLPDFTIYNASNLTNEDYERHGLHSKTFIIFNIEERIAIIGGTQYTGEMKKGIFTVLNYWLPLKGILSMHCSSNMSKDGDTNLFFGLSGTGKTTLSTDPLRALIGDDENGWDDEGIFNFEGGCYAKVINLDRDKEPDIYSAIKKYALLENVIVSDDGNVDFKDSSKTENTRVSYPIYHIENHKEDLKGNHPKNIIFLSADAFGVLPPISKLTKEQAMYYFLSGYTAKVAGTERGVVEPIATFSACFGEVFLPLSPEVYATLLGEKIEKHNVNIFLINTGWIGGRYGVGERISIKNTRACINAALQGKLNSCEYDVLPIFDLKIPKNIDGISDNDILNPSNTWFDKDEYNDNLRHLATLFIENFKRYGDNDFNKYGPKLEN